jgi:hypothetical protein
VQAELDDFQARVLVALVEGYSAREGMKDRIRALNEWEIARRSGYTDISYAEYTEHSARSTLTQALSVLQQRGLVQVWERGVKYDTFVPTVSGAQWARGSATTHDQGVAYGATHEDADASIIRRLDQIISLLRSIDTKLGGP